MNLMSLEEMNAQLLLKFGNKENITEVCLTSEEALRTAKEILGSVSRHMTSEQKQVLVESILRSNTRRMIDESY
ncbi:hypothetical protein [Candidatus Uabimicrobium sp. HlEnr_7]|uniref:hypothetical protein n=1 Tax=Candidatus Uabimicrobium helgolandensis TaxID=3095367 RepID=UPI0035587ACB